MRILIVDDEPVCRRGLRGILECLGAGGISISEAGGAQAVARVHGQPNKYDLVFCDMPVPDDDRIDTLREFSRLGVRSAVVLTGCRDDESLHAAENRIRSFGLNVVGKLVKSEFKIGAVVSLLGKIHCAEAKA